jgi:dephospho-CoA kinase
MVAFLLWRPDVGGIFQKEKCYLWVCRKTKISMLITTESFRARELSLKDSDKLWNLTEYIINNDNYKVEFQPKLVKKISRDFLSLPKIR